MTPTKRRRLYVEDSEKPKPGDMVHVSRFAGIYERPSQTSRTIATRDSDPWGVLIAVHGRHLEWQYVWLPRRGVFGWTQNALYPVQWDDEEA